MSADGDAPVPHEIVIIKRRGGDGDDGHHGGAWKIAFADLMTAMMAFFLVMWLLNVSDKEKIQKIATYFNPMKLNAKKPTVKGIQDEIENPKAGKDDAADTAGGGAGSDGTDGVKGSSGSKKSGGDGEKAEGAAKKAEEELFNDPYGVLARLALKATNGQETAGGGKDDSLLPGGDLYSNPFEPFSQRKAEEEKVETLVQPMPLPPEEPAVPRPGTQPKATGPTTEGPLPPGAPPEKPATAPVPPPGTPAPEAAQQQAKGPTDAAQATAAEAKAVEGDIAKALAALPADKKPNIEVKSVEGGVLISLTDDFRFGMFATSSAEPKPELVIVMDKVAKVLASRDGQVVVRGHTDGRQYKTQKNNNWRLSMSRAQIAYYMLVRGGIQEARFDRIEGYADRDLKIPSDPFAAENRRIEIMLKVPKA